MENVMGVKNPTVAIVNIGVEEEKRQCAGKETYPMLKECKDINFIGSIEARDIPAGKADVVVCEAFVGNVILKLYEGVGATLIKKVKGGMMTNLRSKIGALLVKPALKQTLKAFDLEEYGGAPLLGLKGLVVKTHGSSKSVEIKKYDSAVHHVPGAGCCWKNYSQHCSCKGRRIRGMEFEKLKQIVAEILSVDPRELTEETNFIDDLCADSPDLYQVIQEIEETFEIAIPEEEAEKIKTVGEAVELIRKTRNE